MAKQYGLITSTKAGKSSNLPSIRCHSAFGGDGSDDSDGEKPTLSRTGPGSLQKRQARLQQEKALQEDPTIFQYDELYDDMSNKRKTEEVAQKQMGKSQGPKYIKKLLETAEKRKKEFERRIERQVQKERDEEGEQFKDKESFVTSSYKKKLEEMRLAEEEEKRAEYLESIGDVQKQNNLDGFYRHLFTQKTHDSGAIAGASQPSVVTAPQESKTARQYRKRISETEETIAQEEEEGKESAIRTHIQSNIDADSDFSIDSSDSEDEKQSKEVVVAAEEMVLEGSKEEPDAPAPDIKVADTEQPAEEEVCAPPPEPKIKINVWAKRTVGTAFDEAVERYRERKALKQ